MLQNQLSKPAVTDLLSQNYTSNKQSFIICLAFSNLRHAIHHLERISYGGDCWELRCDLLTPSDGPLGKTNLPSPEFVAEQIDILQQHSQLPVLFTIRTVSQGGRFPDHADKEALELMLLAIDKGCEYIDVEIEWPSSLIQVVSNGKKDAKVIGSYHEWNGNVRWTSQTLKEKYELADSFSDIVKVSIFSKDLCDCFELGLFVREHNSHSTKPLLAIGMGANGQLSRIISPISLVTHSLIPFPSAPGQLTMSEVYRARHLLGQLPKKDYFGLGDTECRQQMLQSGFDEIGFPYQYHVEESSDTKARLTTLMAQTSFGGASFHPIASINDMVDQLSALAETSGEIDTIAKLTDKDGVEFAIGENTQCLAYERCILKGFKSNPGQTVVILASGSVASTVSTALESLGHKVSIVGSLKEYGSLESAAASLLIQSSPENQFRPKDIPANWSVVTWQELQLEQVNVRFSLWTGRPAPETVISQSQQRD